MSEPNKPLSHPSQRRYPADLRERATRMVLEAHCLDALPKRLHPRAKSAIQAIYNAKTRTAAVEAAKAYADAFKDFPKATAKITNELDVLLAFYDYQMEHWVHPRTTNQIESTFFTVRLRTRVTRGPGSRKAALAIAYKLLDAALARWHRIAAPELVPLVRAGAHFIDGKLQERGPLETSKTGTVAAKASNLIHNISQLLRERLYSPPASDNSSRSNHDPSHPCARST